jgi:hypothetical protein
VAAGVVAKVRAGKVEVVVPRQMADAAGAGGSADEGDAKHDGGDESEGHLGVLQ